MDADGEEDLSSKSLVEFPEHVLKNEHLANLFIDYNDIDTLPAEFGKCLVSLKYFSAIGNNLKHLPDSFGELSLLEEVYLNENGLVNLPDSICKLRHLRTMRLTGNQLDFLPDDFGQISSLKVLTCDENMLTVLPKTFGLLAVLEELELGCNKIKCFSEGFGELISLRTLNFCRNQLSELPETFGHLPNLRNLDLSYNRIKFLPSNFKSCHTIEKIFVDRNILEMLPSWVNNLPNCVEFSMKDNNFHEQPFSDRFPLGCPKIKHLNLSGNFITKLPDTFGELSALEYLHLGSVIGELERRNFQNGNWLSELPMSFCFLANLTELHVDENQLNELPENFGDLVSLEIVDFGQNLFHTLPDSFGNLKSLRICMLSKNHLMWLPSNFGELSSLEDLRLDDNELAELPESFCKLSKLKTLDLFSNRLTEIPSALKHLTSLVRLDMECNDFQLPLCDIPQLYSRSNYPDRDPNLKDNWRGRPRQDLTDLVIKTQESVDSMDTFETPAPDLNLTENSLVMAMKRNMSLWKSHADCEANIQRKPARRRFLPRKHYDSASDSDDVDDDDNDNDEDDYDDDISVSDYDNLDNDGEEDQNDDDDDDNFEPPLFVQPTKWSGTGMDKTSNVGNKATEFNAKGVLEETECWEDDIDDLEAQFADANVNPTVETVTYEPEHSGQFYFGPFDLHQAHYVKKPEKYDIDSNQFENCDSDNTCDINVDPVF